MNIKRRKKRGAVVNTHALNDIMFFLLLFFLILSTLANPNVIKVLLPEAGETQQREPKKSLQLAVDEYHDYYLDGEKMSVEQLTAIGVHWKNFSREYLFHFNGSKLTCSRFSGSDAVGR